MITPKANFKTDGGATLVELVVTVGILVTMMVPVLGLLSSAVDTSGKAASMTISARIASRLVGEVQQGDWSSIQNWSNREVFLDYQGQELKDVGEQANAVYAARVQLGPQTGVVLGTNNPAGANPSQRRVVVLVASGSPLQAKELLDQAQAALDAGKPLPRDVRISRTLLVNLEKAL
ncbi:Verru_Chthon cassette protein B [Roseimicrobium gellanilyticum]|nr:Verru_Chthon cassette protein B [Roseimicrobium gellanilyticum]